MICCVVLKDPYRRQGTAYLHVRDDRGADEARLENPTGAVVVPISLATTFEQETPGLATAVGDPNSFGKGYEYSRTGKKLRRPSSTIVCLHIYLLSILPDSRRLEKVILLVVPLKEQWLLPRTPNTV
jgi:hypothetical protein